MSDVLETPQVIDPNEVPFTNTAVRFGVIGGLVFIIYGMIATLTGLNLPSAGFGAIIFNFLFVFAAYGVISSMAVRNHRDKELGGLISFGRAFTVAFIVVVIMGLLSVAFNYFYQTVIDPGLLEVMVDSTAELYEKMGMDEATIEMAMEKVKESMHPTQIMIQGLIMTAVVGGIISLIVAAVMKKNPPEHL